MRKWEQKGCVVYDKPATVHESTQHKENVSTWNTSFVAGRQYINDLMLSVQKSCYAVVQQAYRVPSIVMNGEQIISTGTKMVQTALTTEWQEVGTEGEEQRVSEQNQRQHKNRIGCG